MRNTLTQQTRTHAHLRRYEAIKHIRTAIVGALQPYLGDLADRTDEHAVADLVAKFMASQQFVAVLPLLAAMCNCE